jgi:hypothetical protein
VKVLPAARSDDDPNPKRQALVEEIQRLLKQSQKFLADGAFGGWKREEEAVQKKRTRITSHFGS